MEIPVTDLRLLTAVNGRLGIKVAPASQPEVILLDINLPDFNGCEALEIRREDPAMAQIPVMALSAKGGSAEGSCPPEVVPKWMNEMEAQWGQFQRTGRVAGAKAELKHAKDQVVCVFPFEQTLQASTYYPFQRPGN